MVVFLSCARVFEEEDLPRPIKQPVLIKITKVIDRIWVAVFIREPPRFGAVEVGGNRQSRTLALYGSSVGVGDRRPLQDLHSLITY